MGDGRAFKHWRKQSGITQAQAAERFGVSRQTITQWEAGLGSIPVDLPAIEPQVAGDQERRMSAVVTTVPMIIPYPGETGVQIMKRWPAGLPGMPRERWEGIVQLALQARFIDKVGMVLTPAQPERGWHDVPPWGGLHFCFDIRRNVKGEDCVPDFVKDNVKRIQEMQAEGAPQASQPTNMEGVDTSAWHCQDGSPIDQAAADEIVHNTQGGQLLAAIARELLASHAAGRAPDYAQAQRDIEAARAAPARPTPIPYDSWRKASGVLNLPSRR